MSPGWAWACAPDAVQRGPAAVSGSDRRLEAPGTCSIYTLSIQYLHSIYTVSTLYKQCLHIIYTLSIQYLYSIFVYTLSTVSTHYLLQYLHLLYLLYLLDIFTTTYQSTMLPPAGAHLIGEWFPEPSSTNIITDHDGDHWDCGARAGKELTCTFNYYLIFDSSAVL